jgi:phytoene synthase
VDTLETPETGLDDERRLVIGHAPAGVRPALETLFALDMRLGGIVARTTEPTIGLMRLVWWRDALEALNVKAPPAEPLLRACAASGLGGSALAAMVAGWEALLDDPDLGDEAVAVHASERGARLFALAAHALDPRLAEVMMEPLRAAGRGWARADLARHSRDPDRAAAIHRAAQADVVAGFAHRWPRALRPLGELAAPARLDRTSGARRRLWAMVRHQFTGR